MGGVDLTGIYRQCSFNITSCNLCVRAKVKGPRELNIEQNPSLLKLIEGF